MVKDKDWTGNSSIYACNHRGKESEVATNDFYSTHPESVQLFLKKCKERNFVLPDKIWECAAGDGAISKILEAEGHTVLSTDLIGRGYGEGDVNFLTITPDNLPNEYKPYCKCIMTNPPYACFSMDTEIKTNNGWKHFDDLTAADEVLSLNKDNQQLEWSKITDKYLYDVDDDLINFKSNMVDILVTKNHRMYALNKDNKLVLKNDDLVHAENVKKSYKIPRFGYNWTGINQDYIIIPECHTYRGSIEKLHPALKINMNDWLEFFGLWLADGYCRHTKNPAGNDRCTCGIKQINTNREKVISILNKLPFNYKEYLDSNKTNFEIHNRQLWLYLKQFGKSKDKFIPNHIKNLPKEQLTILFNSYIFGDSSKLKNTEDGIIISSTSKQLMEDFHEILLKLGYLGHISSFNYNDDKVLYCINYVKNKKMNRTIGYGDKKYVKYLGKVFCITLEKNGIFLLRRNGKEFFSGNSAKEFVEKSLELLDNDGICIMFLKLTFLETKKRKELFNNGKLKHIWVHVNRQACGKNGGTFKNGSSATCYAWFIWDNTYNGLPEIDWID